jgi:ligand-binding sensor domain-containing protein
VSTPGKIRWKAAAQFVIAATVVVALGMGADPVIERWRRAHEPEGMVRFRPPHETAALALDGKLLWSGGRDGLALFDWQQAKLLPLPPGTPHLEHIRSLLLDRQGILWVGHGGGIEQRSAGRWKHLDTPLGQVEAVIERANGEIWAGGEKGLAQLKDGKFTIVRDSASLGFAGVWALAEDRKGNLWAGSVDPTHGGLGLLTPDGVWLDYAHNGIAHPSVASIFEDKDGAMWFASGFGKRGGACRWKDKIWKCLEKSDGLTSDRARLIFQDHTGRFWISSETEGLAVESHGGWRWLTPDNGMTGWEIKKIVETPDGTFWLGTEDGVTMIRATAIAKPE